MISTAVFLLRDVSLFTDFYPLFNTTREGEIANYERRGNEQVETGGNRLGNGVSMVMKNHNRDR